LLSTPAASHLIRLNETDGGIILSASHNPGGIDEDFGIKFNTPNGGPAPEAVTDAIFARTTTLDSYKIWEGDAPDIDVIGDAVLGDMQVSIVDPVADYADWKPGSARRKGRLFMARRCPILAECTQTPTRHGRMN